MKKAILAASLALFFFGVFGSAVFARVRAIEILKKEPYTKGPYSGAHGPYELLTGRVHYEVNPYHPLNCGITDLDKAPKNAAGLVEFAADVKILKPVDMQKGNQCLFYYVVNRGGVAEVFNELLMNGGYTIIWSGWQGDILPGKGLLSTDFPRRQEPRPVPHNRDRDDYVPPGQAGPRGARRFSALEL